MLVNLEGDVATLSNELPPPWPFSVRILRVNDSVVALADAIGTFYNEQIVWVLPNGDALTWTRVSTYVEYS